jgi:hypothetical protein
VYRVDFVPASVAAAKFRVHSLAIESENPLIAGCTFKVSHVLPFAAADDGRVTATGGVAIIDCEQRFRHAVLVLFQAINQPIAIAVDCIFATVHGSVNSDALAWERMCRPPGPQGKSGPVV